MTKTNTNQVLTMALPTDSPVAGVGPKTVADITAKYGRTIAAIMAGDTAGWLLSDAVLAEVAPGMESARKADYQALVDSLTKAGIQVPAWNDLRQKRRQAAYWPEADRFPGVSFGAHRYAMDNTLGLEGSKKILGDLLADNGNNPAAVTVTAVKDAVAIAKGVTPPSAKKTTRVTKSTIDTSVSDGETGVTNGDAITRAIAQVRALTREILAEATADDLGTLKSVAGNLIGRIDKVTEDRTKAEARASQPATKVGTAAPKATKATKSTKSTKSTQGMRG